MPKDFGVKGNFWDLLYITQDKEKLRRVRNPQLVKGLDNEVSKILI